jgi:hypothetical protein
MKPDDPQLILAASPIGRSKLEHFFDYGPDTVAWQVEHPGTFRYAGWNLETGDRARIVDGKCWEARNGERKTLRVYLDGSVLFHAAADWTFLGWGKDPEEYLNKPRLNSVAIVEVIASFTQFLANLIPHFEAVPELLQFVAKIENGRVGTGFLYVVAGTVRSPEYRSESEPYPLSTASIETSVQVEVSELRHDPSYAAYALLERLLAEFSMPSNRIPYIAADSRGRRVDVEAIKRI